MKYLCVLLLVMSNSVLAFGDEVDGRKLFEQFKALEGKWRISQPARDTDVSFELIASGSVVVETWRMSPTRKSMTIYTLDGNRLVFTHYCPQGNAPRLFYAGESDDGMHKFDFLDGLNLGDKERSHQHASWIRFDSGDSFTRSETYINNGERYDASEHSADAQVFVRVK